MATQGIDILVAVVVQSWRGGTTMNVLKDKRHDAQADSVGVEGKETS